MTAAAVVSAAAGRANPSLHFPDNTLCGVSRLLEDLHRLVEDRDLADVLFLVGRDEVHCYAHRLLLRARCGSFQNMLRNEICKIPGSKVGAGSPTPIRLPQAKPEVFKEVLFYIYTGKIVLQDTTLFEALALSHELGLEELRLLCEDFITCTLSTHNACTYLASVLLLEHRLQANYAAGTIQKITTFIADNSIECLATPNFLNLEREAVIFILSSDFLAMEEEDVWRAVIRWAKHKAGVTQPPQHWTEEERARVAQFLPGVVNHVRLLMIDSQVFAEEVEPTGVVPIELSLERYRFAALPSKFSQEDRRLQPRTCLRLFNNSTLLSGEKVQLQRLLNAWYGAPKQTWRLLFRASTHGYSSEAFHMHCDGHGPTFVLALGNRGELCGGFTDIPWSKSTGRWRFVSSEKSFLFTLINSADVPPTKFDVFKKRFAVVHHSNYGPIFGAGADLCIASNCNHNMSSYSNLPHSYDGEHASSTILMGDYNFNVADYEVFTPQQNK